MGSQLRSRPESSSPKFAPRLLMPLLARRVLPPGGLTWPTASTPPSSELEMLASVLVFARRATASSESGPATTAPPSWPGSPSSRRSLTPLPRVSKSSLVSASVELLVTPLSAQTWLTALPPLAWRFSPLCLWRRHPSCARTSLEFVNSAFPPALSFHQKTRTLFQKKKKKKKKKK